MSCLVPTEKIWFVRRVPTEACRPTGARARRRSTAAGLRRSPAQPLNERALLPQGAARRRPASVHLESSGLAKCLRPHLQPALGRMLWLPPVLWAVAPTEPDQHRAG